ncbi:MAG: hypothetical protein ACPGVS_00390, partial [Primorskyibacter sp.]
MTRCIVLNIARAAAVSATVALAVASAALAQTAEPPATSASAPQVSSVPAPLRAAFQAELSGAVSDWARATTPRDKFAAAYRRAGALAGLHRWIGAHGWLRIAAQLAPDDAARALVAQSYRALRRKSPLRIDLAFRITPSSNVNNGSAHTHYLNWQLPNTDQALSGTTYGLYGQLGWRIAQDRHRQRTLRLRAGASRVRLDSAPAGVDDADYAQSHLGLSIVTQARPTPRLRTTTEIAVLRLWRAQTPFETRATWDWTSTRHLGP